MWLAVSAGVYEGEGVRGWLVSLPVCAWPALCSLDGEIEYVFGVRAGKTKCGLTFSAGVCTKCLLSDEVYLSWQQGALVLELSLHGREPLDSILCSASCLIKCGVTG